MRWMGSECSPLLAWLSHGDGGRMVRDANNRWEVLTWLRNPIPTFEVAMLQAWKDEYIGCSREDKRRRIDRSWRPTTSMIGRDQPE